MRLRMDPTLAPSTAPGTHLTDLLGLTSARLKSPVRRDSVRTLVFALFPANDRGQVSAATRVKVRRYSAFLASRNSETTRVPEVESGTTTYRWRTSAQVRAGFGRELPRFCEKAELLLPKEGQGFESPQLHPFLVGPAGPRPRSAGRPTIAL